MKLSCAMIVKNEEKTLGRILNDAREFCDELIVVDTGSTDKSVEIATSCGAKIFYFDWTDAESLPPATIDPAPEGP